MKPLADTPDGLVRLVICPTCGGDSVYTASSVFRPFCSERCKQIDLGAWASEQFAMSAPCSPDLLVENNPAV